MKEGGKNRDIEIEGREGGREGGRGGRHNREIRGSEREARCKEGREGGREGTIGKLGEASEKHAEKKNATSVKG